MGCDESGWRAYRQDLAVIHDGDAITNCLRLLHRVCREKDAAPLFAEPLDSVPKLTPRCGSRPDVGSSSRTSGGSWTVAMSSDRRFCCPPDSWLKRLDASSRRWISVRRSKIAGFVSGTPYRPA